MIMVQDNFKITCSEVCIFLKLLGKDYIEKLPNKLYEFFEQEKDINYTLNINMDKSFKEQFKSKDTLLYISYLNLMYWTTEEQKKALIKIYKQNDKKFFKSLSQNNNFPNIFEDKIELKCKSDIRLVEYNDKGFISKLLDRILKFIKMQ